jgi:hypothetical protein
MSGDFRALEKRSYSRPHDRVIDGIARSEQSRGTPSSRPLAGQIDAAPVATSIESAM